MAMTEAKYIWKNGEFVPWADATTHVLTHSLHYGNAVFEGIRAYELEDGKPGVFRLKEHYERFLKSGSMLLMDIPYTVEELCEATAELLKRCELSGGYIRPLAYYGYGTMGVHPQDCPIDVVIACWPWDAYLGEGALEQGVKVQVSSWRQRSANEMPPAIKSSGNYLNSSLAKIEAAYNGYDEAILLNQAGNVAEGSGENLFIVKDGVVKTPPTCDGILEGITRDSIMTIARDLGYEVQETTLLRTDLYTADEAFFSGTAAELTPINSVDRRNIMCPGKITKEIQSVFFDVVHGTREEYKDWIYHV